MVLGIVVQPLQPTDLSALLVNQSLGGLKLVNPSDVLCGGRKGRDCEAAAEVQKRSPVGDTLRIVPVNKIDILAEAEQEEYMAEMAELDNSPTFGQEGVVFDQAGV